MDATGATVIVTGASRGIGKQVAIELGRAGANVVVAARTVEPHRRLTGTIVQTVAAIESAGGRALGVRTDLADEGEIRALAAATIERFGAIDALVNNAADTSGASHTPPFPDLRRDGWLSQFATNVHGPFSLIQAVVPSMQQRGRGVIVNLTSGAADLVPLEYGDTSASVRIGERSYAYAASKAALNRLANVIAPELREMGIAVVNVDPGFTLTELVELMKTRSNVDTSSARSMSVPTKAILHLITCDDPLIYTGSIVRADDLLPGSAPPPHGYSTGLGRQSW